MIKEVMADAHQRMEKTIEALRHELMSIRTGRASPALVEHLQIDYYGTPTPLMQIATISVPEAQQIVIKPVQPQRYRRDRKGHRQIRSQAHTQQRRAADPPDHSVAERRAPP